MLLKSQIITVTFISSLLMSSSLSLADDSSEPEELWSCSGYCFMGGDTPTNPWIPVSSTGSSEQEARDNIDCGSFQEVGITCRHVKVFANYQPSHQ